MFESRLCLYRNGTHEQRVDGGHGSNNTSVWVNHGRYGYLVRNIDICVYLFISVVNKNRNQNGPAPPTITGQKRLWKKAARKFVIMVY